MSNRLTIVMYHYVRDIKSSPFPRIKGLETSLFWEQLEYLKKHYQFVNVDEVWEAIYNNHKLPPKAVLLTFDDNYADHFNNVFPLLVKNKIEGAFFTPTQAITNNKVLEANKLQYVLASIEDPQELLSFVYQNLERYREEYKLTSNENYYKKLAIANRWDTAEVRFIKNLLQAELPIELRNIILNHMLEKYLKVNEAQFSKELYLSLEQIKTMVGEGMHFGLHGSSHSKLHLLEESQIKSELLSGIDFCKSIGMDSSRLTIAYPFGDYDERTKKIAREVGCSLGFTIQPDIAQLGTHDPLELPRLDTNDLPKSAVAPLNKWYEKA